MRWDVRSPLATPEVGGGTLPSKRAALNGRAHDSCTWGRPSPRGRRRGLASEGFLPLDRRSRAPPPPTIARHDRRTRLSLTRRSAPLRDIGAYGREPPG